MIVEDAENAHFIETGEPSVKSKEFKEMMKKLPQDLFKNVFAHMGRKTKDALADSRRVFAEERDATIGKDGKLRNSYTRLNLKDHPYNLLEHEILGLELDANRPIHHYEFYAVAARLRIAFSEHSAQNEDGIDQSFRTEVPVSSTFEHHSITRLIEKSPIQDKPFSLDTIKKYQEINKEVSVFNMETSGGDKILYGITSYFGQSYLPNTSIEQDGFKTVGHEGAYYAQVEHKDSDDNLAKRKMFYVVPKPDGSAKCSVVTRVRESIKVEADDDGMRVETALDGPIFVKFVKSKNSDISDFEVNQVVKKLQSIGKFGLNKKFHFYKDKPVYVPSLDPAEFTAFKKISTPLSPA